ncbi:hypothetical protein [Variovorax paradoxus]|uniref:Uncharacterized protein n=1 Tax=Variovorax paradoxus TaxID=34073 RepID=A0A679J9E5_VARPD|nr:hypothetical protein VVAX_04385 [Variovorax paradoxus]
MIGFAVAIRRDDGSLFFASAIEGFATPVWFLHSQALKHARDCRVHGLDAVVVKVKYHEPDIIGPQRHVGAYS